MAGVEILAIIVGVAWLLFPFVVIKKFNIAAKLQREANQLLKYIADRQKDQTDLAKGLPSRSRR